MKETRDQLLTEMAKLRASHAEWVAADERRRKEFAKAFSWYKKRNPFDGYNYVPNPELPTWEQIWVNLGHLLAARNFMDFEGNISELDVRIEKLEKVASSPTLQ